jgi:hypothetical protein
MDRLQQVYQHIPEPVKSTADALSVLAWMATLTGVVTNMVALVAAVASCLWAVIRIYETKTVQTWLAKRKKPKA